MGLFGRSKKEKARIAAVFTGIETVLNQGLKQLLDLSIVVEQEDYLGALGVLKIREKGGLCELPTNFIQIIKDIKSEFTKVKKFKKYSKLFNQLYRKEIEFTLFLGENKPSGGNIGRISTLLVGIENTYRSLDELLILRPRTFWKEMKAEIDNCKKTITEAKAQIQLMYRELNV
ncbi:hypothetical protein HYT52_03820 [Candidatus Woesearchaeota archaeon]|nr:hypothetical protein [Candidatus Woesearchaeota archaeon]